MTADMEEEIFYDAVPEVPEPNRTKRLSHTNRRSLIEPEAPQLVLSTDRPASPPVPPPDMLKLPEQTVIPSSSDQGDESETETRRAVSGSEGGTSILLRSLDLASQGRALPVKVRSKGSKSRVDFSSLFLVQQMNLGTPVYAMEMSRGGAYLAAACGDGMVRVYASLAELLLGDDAEGGGTADDEEERRTAPIFTSEPVQVLAGHAAEVLDLSWSSNDFLLSASADGTARLWSPSRSECLAVFPHSDLVTSIAFHPTDDRRFITGCFDCRIRLWNVEERKVQAWNELPAANVVTAVGWTGDGRYALAGSSTGVLLFFESNVGFKYYTQILVKSSRGKNAVGRKISSIALNPADPLDSQRLLVSSNDSRLRAYLLRDKSEVAKYLGHTCSSSQIPAWYSDDGEWILSGSEDGTCCIWPADSPRGPFSSKKLETYDTFHAHDGAVCTAALFAPSSIQNKLQAARMRPVLEVVHPADGRVIVSADNKGKIRVFENNPSLPSWLTPPKQ